MNQELVLIDNGHYMVFMRENEFGTACQMPDGRWYIQ